MAQFKLASPLNVPLMLLIPTHSKEFAVESKSYPELSEGILIYGNFRTFGGTERQVNGLYSVENTAIVETWFRSDIKSDCRIGVPQTGQIYDILGEPENIGLRNQYMKFKVQEIKGGV